MVAADNGRGTLAVGKPPRDRLDRRGRDVPGPVRRTLGDDPDPEPAQIESLNRAQLNWEGVADIVPNLHHVGAAPDPVQAVIQLHNEWANGESDQDDEEDDTCRDGADEYTRHCGCCSFCVR